MQTATKGNTTWTYTYNADGLRIGKTNGTITYTYTWNENRQLQSMTWNYGYAIFSYDANGMPYSVKNYDAILDVERTYLYITSLQGDVLSIIDASSGATAVTYTYDAWGRLIGKDGTSSDYASIYEYNPLTYRGYIYDSETGFYYLQSRYYDPSVGRFLNADDTACLGESDTKSGFNLFTYCENNPADYKDPSGYGPVGTIIGGILGFGLGALLVPRVADFLKLKGWGRKIFIWAGVAALTGLGAYVGNYIGEAIFAVYKAGGAFALKINQAIATGIAKVVGGSINAASGNGWVIKIGKLTLRIMTSGGGRTNYFRLSHITKGALTILGAFSGDRGLTHIPITFSNIIKIVQLIFKFE